MMPRKSSVRHQCSCPDVDTKRLVDVFVSKIFFPRTKDTRTNVCTAGPNPNRVFNFFSRPAQGSFEIALAQISQGDTLAYYPCL